MSNCYDLLSQLQNNTYKANQLAKSLRKHKQFFQKKRDGRSLLEATIEEIEKRWNENKKKEVTNICHSHFPMIVGVNYLP